MSETMVISIRLFATLKELAGTNHLSLEIEPGATIETIKAQLRTAYPALEGALSSALAAVNHEYAADSHLLHHQDEIAFFPPVSGGSSPHDWPEIFQLSEEDIDLNAFMAKLITPKTGALALFSGYVRGETSSNDEIIETEYLEYEAYAPMALDKMKQVAAEIRQQWPQVHGIGIVHRIGRLDVGASTVFIACGAGHRDQGCFEAARYGIDRLKEIVPVWKKEVSPQGSHWVEGSYQPDTEDSK